MLALYYLYCVAPSHFFFFFFNDTATTEIYTLSLHDALPISPKSSKRIRSFHRPLIMLNACTTPSAAVIGVRSEEHTSELQSRQYLVCRLLLEKKKNIAALPSEQRSHESATPSSSGTLERLST